MVCLRQAAEVGVEPLLKVSLGKRMKQAKEQVKVWKLTVDTLQKAKGECKHKEVAYQKWERAAWEKQEVKKKAWTAQETEETIVAHDSFSNASMMPPSSRTLSLVLFMTNMLSKAQIMIPCRKEVSPSLSISILTDHC